MRWDIRNRRAKARQAAKLAEIRAALIAGGFDTAAKQAAVLGLGRSTAWAFLSDEKTGGTAKVITYSCIAHTSASGTTKSREYVEKKSRGLYGHSERPSHAFSDEFPELS